MTNSNNDIEELEELLTELEGQEAQIITPYSEEDDAVTRLMDAPLGDQDWMVQITALDRRMMSSSQLLSDLQAGKVNARTLVWRGGMDDWMPISRIDELSRASSPAPLAHGTPRGAAPRNLNPGNSNPSNSNPGNSNPGNGAHRAAFTNLAPPPPAPQRSQPVWSNPPSAPLPPPPSAMSPPFGMAPGMGMPPPPMALAPPPPPPPMALTPPPPPPNPNYGLPMQMQSSSSSPDLSMSQGNTTRPVAVDFSDMSLENDPPLQSKRWVMALSAVAILAVFVTVYSLSSGGGENESKAATAVATRPQAVNALQPSAAAPKEKPAASAPSAAPIAAAKAEAPVAAAAKPSDDDESESEATESTSARQTAQARYTPRSDYRRRSRGGSASDEKGRSESADEEEPAAPPKPAAAVAAAAAPSSTARPAEEEEAPSEAVAATAEEVDEPAKGKSSNNTFNREAAKAALDEAAGQAKNCRPQGGPSGTGRVQVRYEPSGKVSNVAILTSKFDNTTAGSCVRMLFRRAKVPEFTGAPVMVVNKSFEIP
jgi:hypothetical protein